MELEATVEAGGIGRFVDFVVDRDVIVVDGELNVW